MVNGHHLYLYVTDAAKGTIITLPGLASSVSDVIEDGTTQALEWAQTNDQLKITLPSQLEEPLVPVLKVTLQEELRMIPTNAVASAGDTWTITPENISYGHSYCDEGNYTSTTQTKVRLTAYVASEKTTNVFVDFQGNAQQSRLYRIQIGDQEQTVTGKALIDDSLRFTLPAKQIVPLTITLADPAYKGEDLGIDVKQFVISEAK
ncbi:hypothetical protein G4V62_11465 [Bacillaceae bacterium SIJ1]|uniref:hypothetical protein n=1 Tax=Litoribacterium kuwaitense TaxID=1398745 RepID=UPI0013EDC9AE|nr:hypothetical protein [Litoribacterium kuwaitense]NGP45544.1 hypothetical protein [Litoribacterium kuwaitense]